MASGRHTNPADRSHSDWYVPKLQLFLVAALIPLTACGGRIFQNRAPPVGTKQKGLFPHPPSPVPPQSCHANQLVNLHVVHSLTAELKRRAEAN